MRRSNALTWIYLTALFGFVFAPIVTSMVFSFNSDRFPTVPLGHFTLHWYETAFARPEVWTAFRNSLIVAATAGALSTALGFATAYTDFRYGFRFKNAYLALALLPRNDEFIEADCGGQAIRRNDRRRAEWQHDISHGAPR